MRAAVRGRAGQRRVAEVGRLLWRRPWLIGQALEPMSEPAPERVVRLHYMEGFACLGSECSDTCCGFWAIQIDQDHYARLQGQLAEPAAERARFEAAFRLAPEAARTREHHALMVLNVARGATMALRYPRAEAVAA